MVYDVLSIHSCSFNSRSGTNIVGIVLHCLGFLDLKDCIKGLTYPETQVSAHYLVPQVSALELKHQYPDLFGSQVFVYPWQVPVIEIVPEEYRAWHAGRSLWSNWNEPENCRLSLNSCTIGIEFHSPGYGIIAGGNDFFHFSPYSQEQVEIGSLLIQDIVLRYGLDPRNLVAHSDIAFDRKTDPGPLFFWNELNEKGLGYLPDLSAKQKVSCPYFSNTLDAIVWMQKKFRTIGYASCPVTGTLCTQTQRIIDAYRMHFFTENWQGPNHPPSSDLIASMVAFEYQYDI